MPAGGFKTFVANEILTAADTNDFLMQGVLVFASAAARTSAIPSPVEGQFTFRTDDDVVEFYDGSAWVELSGGDPFTIDYLLISGGGGGGAGIAGQGGGGGGGAGGYRCSVNGETSGANSADERAFLGVPGVAFTVTVGAGGASGGTTVDGSDGGDSSFGPATTYGIESSGGGGGGKRSNNGRAGGSGGGGGGGTTSGGSGIVPEGFAGAGTPNKFAGSGGGGAGGLGAAAGTPTDNDAGAGGVGLSSSITGSAVTRAVGGDGGDNGSTAGGSNGTANRGNGGGGGTQSGGSAYAAGAGGSGVVIIKYPDTLTPTIGGGLTSSTTSSGGFKITTFTAGTDTVTF